MFCAYCGNKLKESEKFCGECGKEAKSKYKDSMGNTNNETGENINSDNLFQRIGKIGEAEGVGEFKFQRFFGGIFKKHTVEEIEQSLIVGTKKTTPEINEVILEYPQPWLFFRLVSASIILFYAFFFAYRYFENTKLVPGLIFSGSFAVPISTLFLFFELNIRKNVPLWQVIRLVFFGGILSMVITLILFQNTESLSSAFGASSAGLIEEPAKLGALIFLMRGKNIKKYPYILNGLLLGASVGCGFAAFESAGYALESGLFSSTGKMIESIQLRGILSPFGHIVWTAVSGAALWRVKKGGNFSFELFKDKRFFKPFGLIVACHFIWNSGLPSPFMSIQIICGIISWVVALSLVNLGIQQIAKEKSGEKIFKI